MASGESKTQTQIRSKTYRTFLEVPESGNKENYYKLSYSGGVNALAEHPPQEGPGQADGL